MLSKLKNALKDQNLEKFKGKKIEKIDKSFEKLDKSFKKLDKTLKNLTKTLKNMKKTLKNLTISTRKMSKCGLSVLKSTCIKQLQYLPIVIL